MLYEATGSMPEEEKKEEESPETVAPVDPSEETPQASNGENQSSTEDDNENVIEPTPDVPDTAPIIEPEDGEAEEVEAKPAE